MIVQIVNQHFTEMDWAFSALGWAGLGRTGPGRDRDRDRDRDREHMMPRQSAAEPEYRQTAQKEATGAIYSDATTHKQALNRRLDAAAPPVEGERRAAAAAEVTRVTIRHPRPPGAGPEPPYRVASTGAALYARVTDVTRGLRPATSRPATSLPRHPARQPTQPRVESGCRR